MREELERGGDDGERRRRRALLALIVVLVLAIAGILLMRALVQKSNLEDCLLAGRRNCAPIAAPARE